MSLTLLTDRLRLTPISESHIDLAIEMFTDPDVVKYLCDPLSEDEIRSEMPTWIKRGGNGCIGIWCISNKVTGEHLGSIFLLPLPIDDYDTDFSLLVSDNMPNSEIEIGYVLKKLAWGAGYATEACKRLLQFAFEETSLNEIVATFDEENVSSKHVLEKSGLIDCGYMYCYGEDSIIFRISREHWKFEQPPTH